MSLLNLLNSDFAHLHDGNIELKLRWKESEIRDLFTTSLDKSAEDKSNGYTIENVKKCLSSHLNLGMEKINVEEKDNTFVIIISKQALNESLAIAIAKYDEEQNKPAKKSNCCVSLTSWCCRFGRKTGPQHASLQLKKAAAKGDGDRQESHLRLLSAM